MTASSIRLKLQKAVIEEKAKIFEKKTHLCKKEYAG
jgi:hypothetical protein